MLGDAGVIADHLHRLRSLIARAYLGAELAGDGESTGFNEILLSTLIEAVRELDELEGKLARWCG